MSLLIALIKVIINRNEYIEECKKELLESIFYEQTDESNLQKQNTTLRNEIINFRANNYISEKVKKKIMIAFP